MVSAASPASGPPGTEDVRSRFIHSDDEEDANVARRRGAEEALMAAIEFDAIWETDVGCRGAITGERVPGEKTNGGAHRRPRRPGSKPTASDLAREAREKEKDVNDAEHPDAHPAAALFRDPEWRRARVASLYPFIAPALTPRDALPNTGDGGGVARGLSAAPAALFELDPRSAAIALVRLREARGESADLVRIVTADPSVLLTFATRSAKGADRDERAARAAAVTAADRVVTRVSTAVGAAAASDASPVTDGREDGKWRVGGTYKGTSSRAEDLKVRFWNLWGGSSECRRVVTASPRGSVFRDPGRMEAAVTRLDRYVPFVDVPMLLHRAPALLELDAEEVVRRVVRMKRLLRGGDVGRLLGLAPSLLLAPEGVLEAAVTAVAEEAAARGNKRQGGGGEGGGGVVGHGPRATYDAVAATLQGGGAEALLARGMRGEGGARGVVLVTERAETVHMP